MVVMVLYYYVMQMRMVCMINHIHIIYILLLLFYNNQVTYIHVIWFSIIFVIIFCLYELVKSPYRYGSIRSNKIRNIMENKVIY